METNNKNIFTSKRLFDALLHTVSPTQCHCNTIDSLVAVHSAEHFPHFDDFPYSGPTNAEHFQCFTKQLQQSSSDVIISYLGCCSTRCTFLSQKGDPPQVQRCSKPNHGTRQAVIKRRSRFLCLLPSVLITLVGQPHRGLLSLASSQHYLLQIRDVLLPYPKCPGLHPQMANKGALSPPITSLQKGPQLKCTNTCQHTHQGFICSQDLG